MLASAVAVAAAAVSTVLAYPPAAMPGLGLVMLAPLAAATDGVAPRRAFVLVYAWGLAIGVTLVRWLAHALVGEYSVAPAPAWAFLAILVAALAAVPAAAAALYARLSARFSDALAPLAFAALWVLGEWLRGAALGVPWLLTAQSWSRVPLAIQTAELGGVWIVGFLSVAVNAGLGVALRRRSAVPLALPAACAAAALGFGAWRLEALGTPPGPGMRVGVVQVSVPQAERFQPGSALRNVARYAEATKALAGRERLDLVVWSETAVDVDLDASPALRVSLEELATQIGVPLLTGAPRSANARRTNAVVLFAPGRGLVESYDKQRLVPYSEYDPPLGAPFAPLIGPVTLGEAYAPGDQPTVFHAAPIPFSTPVCFEISYPDLLRGFWAAGARLLVNLSNDAWFGPTGYPEMHLANAIFRAVELRTWVVRGANTGISAAIDPAGRVAAEIPAFAEGSFAVDVAPAGPPTLYARAGDRPILAALGVVLVAALARRDRARRRRPPLPTRDRAKKSAR